MNALLDLAAHFYGAAIGGRARLYDRGVLRALAVARPVISVGNLAVGGTGKTPFVRLLAERLAERRVAILSRGYGARDPARSPRLVSRYGEILEPVARSGDEPQLLARTTRASVVVCPNRVAAARFAIDALGADLLLLDDGFQHRRLARSLDLVLLDARAPFGNGKLLPAGRLREAPEALARAHALVLNHGATRAPIDAPLPPLPRIEVVARVEAHPGRVALLSGIARPERFRASVEAAGGEVVLAQAYGDHHWFTPREVDAFITAARAKGAERLLTTEKDLVRLPDDAPLEAVPMRLEIVEGEAILDRLLAEALA